MTTKAEWKDWPGPGPYCRVEYRVVRRPAAEISPQMARYP